MSKSMCAIFEMLSFCIALSVLGVVSCVSRGPGTLEAPHDDTLPRRRFLYEDYFVLPTSWNNTENIDINIESVFPGEVTWKGSSNDSFEIYIVAYEERQGQLVFDTETTELDIKMSLVSQKLQIRIKTQDKIPALSVTFLPQNAASLVTVNVVCIILTILISLDHRMALLLAVVASVTFVSCVDPFLWGRSIRCDVIIHYPRNTTFSNISITVPNGRISVPHGEIIAGEVTCVTNNTSEGCPFCCHGNGFCGPGDVCVCKESYDNERNCESLLKPKYKLYTGKMDPRLAVLESLDRFTHLLIGRRRHDGAPRTLTEIRSRDMDGNEVVIGLKRGKHIKEMFTSGQNGTRLQWIDPCTLFVTRSDIGTNDTRDMVILNTCPSRDPQGQTTQKKTKKTQRKDFNILSFKRKSFKTLIERSNQNIIDSTQDAFLSADYKILYSDEQQSNWKKSFIKVPIEVKRCGESDLTSTVYASVFVKRSDSDSMLPVLKFKGIADYVPGSFYVKLPSEQIVVNLLSKDYAHPLRMCNHFRKAAIKVCNKNKRILASNITGSCASLVLNEKVQNASVGIRQRVLETCEQGYKALQSYCGSLAAIAESSECIDSFTEQEQFFVSAETRVIFTVIFPGGHSVQSSVYRFNTSAAHVTETIILEGISQNPKILNFSINPPDPRPNQGYEAIIHYKCVSESSELHMRVEGDDSYTSDVTCHGNQQCSCCTLHVAGATAHVTDIVKVRLYDSISGVNITRQYRVTF